MITESWLLTLTLQSYFENIIWIKLRSILLNISDCINRSEIRHHFDFISRLLWYAYEVLDPILFRLTNNLQNKSTFFARFSHIYPHISAELFLTKFFFIHQVYVQVSQEDYKCTFPARQTWLGKPLLFYPIYMAGTADSKYIRHYADLNSNFSHNFFLILLSIFVSAGLKLLLFFQFLLYLRHYQFLSSSPSLNLSFIPVFSIFITPLKRT